MEEEEEEEEGVPAKATVDAAHPPSAIQALLSLTFPTDVSNSTGQGIIKLAEASIYILTSFYFLFSGHYLSLVGAAGEGRGTSP